MGVLTAVLFGATVALVLLTPVYADAGRRGLRVGEIVRTKVFWGTVALAQVLSFTVPLLVDMALH